MIEPAQLLFRTHDLLAGGLTPRGIQAEVKRGALVRIRRGIYCQGAVWLSLTARQRHVLRAAAVSMDVDGPVFAGRTAAAIWGIPVIGGWPTEVAVLSDYRGGGKSAPGVRRTVVGFRGAPTEVLGGLRVTSLARTVVDLAAREGLTAGTVAADWALAHQVERSGLEHALRSRSSRYGSKVASRVVEFADSAAESPGESAARSVFLQLGFEIPELQVVMSDDEGEMRPDYFWRAARITGEFDGKLKYSRGNPSGFDPADVVWHEKKREDRLRRLHPGHVRILWSHVKNPFAMTRLLTNAGVPRRST